MNRSPKKAEAAKRKFDGENVDPNPDIHGARDSFGSKRDSVGGFDQILEWQARTNKETDDQAAKKMAAKIEAIKLREEQQKKESQDKVERMQQKRQDIVLQRQA